MNWPTYIKDLRTRLGLTRAGFAERLGVGYSTVCLWEQGRTKPDRRNAAALQRLSDESEGK
ncbi:MAG TPA: helix-turn-helix domain-containing protein [Anaerolineae bacterium]|nr:helix-turn-helix domain-containing protein [Anaerolineae bacterium]